MPEMRDRARQPFVIANPETHVMRILDRSEIQMPPPDKGPERRQKALARGDVACAGARLDVGRSLPCSSKAFVIALGGLHRDRNRRDRGVGAQSEIGPEDIAIGGSLGQGLGHPADDSDETRPCVGVIIRVETGFVE